jgi:hypothetical protein
MNQIRNLLSKYTGLAERKIDKIINKAPASYKSYQIQKKNGGYREINHPAKETKTLQYALIELLFKKFNVHEIAMAYKRGVSSPTKKNADLHKDYKYSLRIDFKDFFPSIKPEDIISILKNSSLNEKFEFKKFDYDDIKKICFRRSSIKNYKYGLAVGAPSSPIISNVVMRDFDDFLNNQTEKIDENATVTRYADDIIFSTNGKGLCKKFYDSVKNRINDFESPDLELNEDKTSFMSKGTKRVITGLVITNDGQVSIGYEKKEEIKRLVYKSSKGELEEDEISSLKGYLAYIQDVEPSFFDKLVIKYSAETFDNIMSDNKN